MMSDRSFKSDYPKISELFLWNMLPDRESRVCFHMPGHLSGHLFSDEYYRELVMTDTTELPRTDDLHDPAGPVLRAAEVASRCYGSSRSFFVTTGSTTGIRVMMASVFDENSFFLFPRTAHISVLYTAAILDLPYAWIRSGEPEDPDPYLLPVTTAESVKAAIIDNPQATDVLIVSPDYYGRCADISAIANVVHHYGLRLLVDEAHGSHFPFCPEGSPSSAMNSGADISVMSIHKTMPAMTMASMLHVSKDAMINARVEEKRIYDMLRAFETSSPSFPIAASSEYAIAWAKKNGESLIRSTISHVKDFYKRTDRIGGVQPIITSQDMCDPLRMVLKIDHPKVSARQVHEQLSENGIDIEFSDLKRLVILVSPGQPPEDFDRLLAALSIAMETDAVSSCIEEAEIQLNNLEILWKQILHRIPVRSMSVREAFFSGKRKSIALENSAGAVLAAPISPYPPGIPLIWPGEVITNEHILLLKGLNHEGITIAGLHDGNILIRY
jgi:arginine/lysine/ornithine decarboxylase